MASCVARFLLFVFLFVSLPGYAQVRERISFNDNWRFYKYSPTEKADGLIYDARPAINGYDDSINADAKPTDAVKINATQQVLKPWIMPTGNAFIGDTTRHHPRPAGEPGAEFAFVQTNFDDSSWEALSLPHDWAIKGPFYTGNNPEVGGGMGRLPSHGVAWYRKQFKLTDDDAGKQIYLDIDGAMSYSMVWLNGHLVGGWPYGYSSYRLDLTPYLNFDSVNQLAIRLDNPNNSSRWYPGGGIYRNVWLVKTSPVHVDQWGTQVVTENVSTESAEVKLTLKVKNAQTRGQAVRLVNKIYQANHAGKPTGALVSKFATRHAMIAGNYSEAVTSTVTVSNPRLWGPVPSQTPHRYVIVSQVYQGEKLVDEYHTLFGIRKVEFDPNQGVLVNGEHIALQGVNQHHDLGALGAAFNVRAAQRQLEILQEMGVNAIRMAHNPPAPELLALTDKMGILVLNESFDSWYKKKTPHDFHLIFADWHEQDLRALVRRDRNHPSVIMWYIGNEVGEQYTGEEGAEVALKLKSIVKQEDPTRPVTASKNWAKADFPFSAALDLISLNYQGEGIRQLPEFEGTNRIRTPPSYPAFHKAHPDKVILSSETASAFSSRGIYLFPVTPEMSAPTRDGRGGDSSIHQVSSYELHAVDFGSSADKVFKYLDTHPYVAGQFVWNGFDYLGEPTPYYSSRSSYSGIIDLAGFKKDRFYLYQSQWRPELPMVHILPHWNWPERVGKVTPVHIFTSGDEVELFINGQSMGRKKMAELTYRIRFDDIRYEPGEVTAVAYKNGRKWAEQTISTTGKATALRLTADRGNIAADGTDLSFVTLEVIDSAGRVVPTATHQIAFSVDGDGQLVATDNGDSTNFTPFPSATRKAFSGKALAIVKSARSAGDIVVTAKAEGLSPATITISAE